MSTRAGVVFEYNNNTVHLYSQTDGYPASMEPFLNGCIQEDATLTLIALLESLEHVPCLWVPEHSDIEFVYVIDGESKEMRVYTAETHYEHLHEMQS